MGASEMKKKDLIKKINELIELAQILRSKGKSDEEINNLFISYLEDKDIDHLVAIINKLLDIINKFITQLQTSNTGREIETNAPAPELPGCGGGRK